jgi:hypothetical protein
MEVGCSRIESETELISSLAPLKKAAPRILLASLGWMSDPADRYGVQCNPRPDQAPPGRGSIYLL